MDSSFPLSLVPRPPRHSRAGGNPVKHRVAPGATLYIAGCRNKHAPACRWPGSGMTRKAGNSYQEWESACKPGSVKDNHSSGMYVAIHLLRPTRGQCGPHYHPLIWPCSRRGLPCRACCQARGALLPHHFTLTRPGTGRAVYFLLHFPSARAAQELPGALPMWSPDFPLP